MIILILWYGATSLSLVNPLFAEPPQEVFITLIKLVFSGNIVGDIGATLYRTVVGFFLAALIGIPIGIAMGYFRVLYNLFDFFVDFLRSVPATALFPLFLLFFGVGNLAKIAIVVFSSSLIIIVNGMYGVRTSSPQRVRFAKSMGASPLEIFRKVVFFEALPDIFAGLRVSLSLSLVLIVVTEMFIGTRIGLGLRIFNAHLTYRIDEMYAAIILAGLVGYLLNKGFFAIERRVVHWAGK